MKLASTLAVIAVGALGLAIAGCGSKQPAPQPQPYAPMGSYPANTGYQPGQQPTASPTDVPAAAPSATAAPAQPAPVAVPDATVIELVRPQVTASAKKHAQGMKADFQMFGGMLNEGESRELQATLLPGKCYTVVGIGMPNIQELDTQIVFPNPLLPTMPPTVLAADTSAGPESLVAPAPNCYKNLAPLGVPVKIVMKATKGAGPAAAQMYVK